jgi:hypothetical protein
MKKSGKPKWQGSIGKKQLIDDLRNGVIPITGGDIETIYAMRLEFGGDDREQFKRFPYRLRSARKQVEEVFQLAASATASLHHDRQLYPKQEFNNQNMPRWQGSLAEALLKIDLENGKHLEMKPSELYITQGEYKKFSLHIFRGHIYQEEKRKKFIQQYGARNKYI